MILKPKGTYDLLKEDAIIYKYIDSVVDEVMGSFNYEYVRTPIIEASELFHRSVGEGSDIVVKETYDFKDRGDRLITLRPEGTAGVVRSFIENKLYGGRNDAVKLYYSGTMYRYERPQAGRNREFSQFGAEVFGSNDVLIDAEVISMGYYLLKTIGIGDITVKLNSLGDTQTREDYTKALKDYLKPHLDSLCDDCKRRYEQNPLRILDCKVDADSEVLKNVPKLRDYLSPNSKERLEALENYLMILDIDYEIDDHIVRGLDYYDEVVWEYKNDEDITLGGGGRYNSLVKNLGGPDTPAVGFACGIDRIIIELKKQIKEDISKEVDIYIMSVSEEEKMHSLTLAQDLRLNNVVTEINNTNLSLKSQFKIADRLKAKHLIILNDEDLQRGLVTVKDNATKEEEKVDESEIVDYIISHI